MAHSITQYTSIYEGVLCFENSFRGTHASVILFTIIRKLLLIAKLENSENLSCAYRSRRISTKLNKLGKKG
jgi:hypothetical protein